MARTSILIASHAMTWQTMDPSSVAFLHGPPVYQGGLRANQSEGFLTGGARPNRTRPHIGQRRIAFNDQSMKMSGPAARQWGAAEINVSLTGIPSKVSAWK